MRPSPLAPQFARYERDRIAFAADIDQMAQQWNTNYTHPLSLGYMRAKKRLDDAATAAAAVGRFRAEQYAIMKGRIDMAVGIAFALLGPLAAEASKALKPSLMITDDDVLDRASRYFSKPGNKLSADELLDRAVLRQTILNKVTDVAYDKLNSTVAPGTFSSGPMTAPSAPAPTGARGTIATAPGGVNLGSDNFSGEYSAERFELNVRNVFESMALDMKRKYLDIENAGGKPAERKLFLQSAFKSVLLTPPEQLIDQFIPSRIMDGALFAMFAANYLMSFTVAPGMAGPQIHPDYAYQINIALNEYGYSIIRNNPTMNANDNFMPTIDRQLNWDGLMLPPVINKIKQIGASGAKILETYMQALAAA